MKKGIGVLTGWLIVWSCFVTYSQTSTIKGIVKDGKGKPVEMVQVVIKELNVSTSSDTDGSFVLNNVLPGNYTLVALLMGYETEEKKIIVTPGQTLNIPFIIKEKTTNIKEIVVVGKSITQEVREQAFTVNSINVTALKNENLDVNQVLNRSTGVRIRESGGLGSDFSFSLNGFTGNQVKFFIDGMPTDFMGSSMSLNNIPVNIIDRIEVYKGVVPVNLGADALGGAVNVVTNTSSKNYLDASYSYGSFNTHRGSIVGRITGKKGFMLGISGFSNYSDNNYTIDAEIPDKNTGKIGKPVPVQKFNDGYRSNSIMLETGLVNKKFADKLLIGLIVAESKKEVQQGSNMTKVAGEVFTTDASFVPTFKYQKSNLVIKGLSLNMAAMYSENKSAAIDTSSKIYDWNGDFKYRAFGRSSGELNWDKTQFTFKDQAALITATIQYKLQKHHTFVINNTNSWFERVGEDPLKVNPIAFANPNTIKKNVTGFSYQLDLWDKRFSTTAFGKAFNLNTFVYDHNDGQNTLSALSSKTTNYGYGIASTFFINKNLQLKSSFEDTYRLPEGYELFGDGLLLLSNPTLKPEQSKNFNAGVLYGKKSDKHTINIEGGYIYRLPINMIRLKAIGITSRYVNLSTSQVMGVEGGISYEYKYWFKISTNATYQNIINTNKVEGDQPDPLYLDRLPNVPFLFGNASTSFQTKEFGKHQRMLSIGWSSSFVEAFYLNWPSQGAKDSKFDIPRQVAHTLTASFSTHAKKYNISLSCDNIANAMLYDNFRLQKPGRSFNVKLHYFLSK